MNKRIAIWGVAWALLGMMSSCGGHSHDYEHGEEGHDHSKEQVQEEHGHDHEGVEHNHGKSGGETDEIVISSAKAKAAGIMTAVVQPGDFAEVVEASGRMESAQGGEVTLVAHTSGVVKLIRPMTEGAPVSRGTVLMTVNSKDMPDSDPYVRAQIAYEAAKAEYERGQKLLENRLISEREFTALKETYENARLSYTSLSRNYKAGNQQIQSTIDGFVQRCLVRDGDYVEAGQPVASVAQNRRLYVKVDVPEKYYASLAAVRSANLRLPSGEVLELDRMNGKVVSYGRSLGDSYYVPMTLSFDNQGRAIPGSFVEVYLLAAPRPHILTVPQTALVEEQGLYFVFLRLDEECYRKQEVSLGATDGSQVEILSGLKKGDCVVVKGAYQVKLAGATNAIPAHSHSH